MNLQLLLASTRSAMTKSIFKLLICTVALIAVIALMIPIKSKNVRADEKSEHEQDASKVQIGFDVAPVHLNLHGKNRELVGLGSYIVNVTGDCNGCHSAGPNTEYVPGGSPYMLRPPQGPYTGKTEVNPATYLGGGRDFGPYPGLVHLYSRNLTPDKTGRAEGGHTFDEFLQIMRTGVDFDHLHPTCSGAPDGSCIPAPFNGAVLQIMPWPSFQSMTDHDLRAIYEYLSAIPCIDTNIAGAPVLRNDCD
jgi:hypothetical protein